MDIHAYNGVHQTYAWHITDLVIYDKPKELGEFKKLCNHKNDCCACKHAIYCLDPVNSEYQFSHCEFEMGLKRPPQSWYYVEELGV